MHQLVEIINIGFLSLECDGKRKENWTKKKHKVIWKEKSFLFFVLRHTGMQWWWWEWNKQTQFQKFVASDDIWDGEKHRHFTEKWKASYRKTGMLQIVGIIWSVKQIIFYIYI